MTLSQEQKDIINYEDNCFISASAGSGKTTTCGYKVYDLVTNKNYDPENIFLFSFSRTASKELKDKIKELLPYKKIHISTIHSFAYKIINTYKSILGIYSEISIKDEGYFVEVIKNYLQDKIEYRDMEDKSIKEKALSFINRLIKQMQKNEDIYFEEKNDILCYNYLESVKQKYNYWSFLDLLYKGYRIINSNNHIKNIYRNDMKVIVVDECLPYYMPVIMENNQHLPIGKIVEEKIQGKVLCYNEITKQQEYKEIKNWFKIVNNKKLLKISIKSKNTYIKNKDRRYYTSYLTCTENHKIFTYNRGYVYASDLLKGDLVQYETSCIKTNKYKITSKGKETLSSLMKTDNKSLILSSIGNKTKKSKETFNAIKGGNGRGLTIPQEILFNRLSKDTWESEMVVTIPKDLKLKYNTPNNYKVDIGSNLYKIAIEIDGESHNNTNSKIRDNKKNNVLDELGYKVIRFTNKEIIKDIDEISYKLNNYDFCFKDNDCPIICEVTDIQETESNEYYVYDIEVEDNHNFYANGVLVHNCQDTSILQIQFLDMFITDKTKLIFIGDIKQTLYRFNYADPYYIMDYCKSKNINILGLTTTFRFGNNINKYANIITSKMIIPEEYKLKTNILEDSKDEVKYMNSIDVKKIVDDIEYKIHCGEKLDSMGILYRYNKQSLDFQKELTLRKIPFYVAGNSFLNRVEIKLCLSIIELLRKYDLQTAKYVFNKLSNTYIDIGTLFLINEVYNEGNDNGNIIDFLKCGISKKIKKIGVYRKQSLSKILYYFEEVNNILNSKEFSFRKIADIFDFDNLKFMEGETKEGISNAKEKNEFIKYLDNIYNEFKNKDNTVYDFITNLKLSFSNSDDEDKMKDKVLLSTIHGSKGMTIPYTYLLLQNFYNEVFYPEIGKYDFNKLKNEDIENLYKKYCEDEYFVLYVAITRAKKELHIIPEDINNVECKPYYFLFDKEFKPIRNEEVDENNIDTTKSIDESNKTVYYSINLEKYASKDINRKDFCIGNNVEIVRETEKAVNFKISNYNFWCPKKDFKYCNNKIYISFWLVNTNEIMRNCFKKVANY